MKEVHTRAGRPKEVQGRKRGVKAEKRYIHTRAVTRAATDESRTLTVSGFGPKTKRLRGTREHGHIERRQLAVCTSTHPKNLKPARKHLREAPTRTKRSRRAKKHGWCHKKALDVHTYLHVADGDAVVPVVPHHLILNLLPAAKVL